ncbi:MAG: hypothetical protein K2P51_09025 [Rhabdochlamydiaceae bacterium]|nr:hypothetical protein [Rhabdochlamydiaceae bacterium]
MDSFPLEDPVDFEIIKHRDAHFGGSFSIMRDYYEKEGKGIQPEFELFRIDALEKLEQESQQNLFESLSEGEKEEVERAKQKYLSLRQIYENPQSAGTLVQAIADLILSEEDDPSQEIAAVVLFGEKAVGSLVSLIKNDDFYNPLFPGYGEAPALAARALGLIGDERAIIPLFHALGKQDFFTEEAILEALRVLGENAQEFLVNTLIRMPITKENEHAAIALAGFKEDVHIARACLHMLQQEQTLQKPTFAAYLVLCCPALKAPKEQEAFIALSQHPHLSRDLKYEMDIVISKWRKEES